MEEREQELIDKIQSTKEFKEMKYIVESRKNSKRKDINVWMYEVFESLSKLIDTKEMLDYSLYKGKKYVDDNFAAAKDIALGDKNIFEVEE